MLWSGLPSKDILLTVVLTAQWRRPCWKYQCTTCKEWWDFRKTLSYRQDLAQYLAEGNSIVPATVIHDLVKVPYKARSRHYGKFEAVAQLHFRHESVSCNFVTQPSCTYWEPSLLKAIHTHKTALEECFVCTVCRKKQASPKCSSFGSHDISVWRWPQGLHRE